MTYKTIMVCLNEVDRIDGLLDVAIEVAEHQGAHILGMYVIPAVQIYPSVAIDLSPQIFEAYRSFFKRHAHRVTETFDDRMRRSGLNFEWCLVNGETPLVADTRSSSMGPSTLEPICSSWVPTDIHASANSSLEGQPTSCSKTCRYPS